jgi:hypothetical protein
MILQLHAGWTIEDVVRWILDPGGNPVLAALQGGLPGFNFANLDALRDLLKTPNANNVNGLKENVLAHEIVVGAIEEFPACRARAVEFCEALVAAATGANHARMVKDVGRSTPLIAVMRFTP